MGKYVITGAPGTGKTTIVEHLKKIGYSCKEEISRKIISEQIAKNGEALPWKNLNLFSKKVFDLRKKQFLKSKEKLCFFDRGIVDTYAYLEIGKLEISSNIKESIKTLRYNKKVFYTPVWEEIYTKDKERRESLEQAKKIEENLISCYSLHNYQLIKIPIGNIEKRVKFILSKI